MDNFKKFPFPVCRWLKFLILRWPQKKYLFKEFRQFFQLGWIENVSGTLYCFSYGHFLQSERKQPSKCSPENRCSQNPGNFFVKYLWKKSCIFNKIARERPAARLERNSLHLLNILPRLWATLYFFPKFSELFCRKPFTAYLWFT